MGRAPLIWDPVGISPEEADLVKLGARLRSPHAVVGLGVGVIDPPHGFYCRPNSEPSQCECRSPTFLLRWANFASATDSVLL